MISVFFSPLEVDVTSKVVVVSAVVFVAVAIIIAVIVVVLVLVLVKVASALFSPFEVGEVSTGLDCEACQGRRRMNCVRPG